VSTYMKPACMNMTRKPVTSVQTMLIENTLCVTRSYTSVTAREPGASPLPSPAGVAHTPAAPPVGSGQVGFAGSVLAPLKYAGSAGASAEPGGAAAGAASAGAASAAGAVAGASSSAFTVCEYRNNAPRPAAQAANSTRRALPRVGIRAPLDFFLVTISP